MVRQPVTIGRYRIVRRLGAGAMGVVYLAHDPVINRRVAIKVLPSLVDDHHEELRRRFEATMRWAGGLTHPNIAAIYDAGDVQGQPFIAMEYVEGETLEGLCANPALLTIGQRIHLLDQLCQGLHHAHLAKVIHRDIKPANVLITPELTLKIVDFGIARLVETGVTQATFAGTVGYMSPEQLEGRIVDHRSDLFAVGVVAYQLLSGQRPFGGESPQKVMLQTLTVAPRPLGEVVAGLSADLIAVVERALQKDRDDRFENLESMRVALRAAAAALLPRHLDSHLHIRPDDAERFGPTELVNRDGPSPPLNLVEGIAASPIVTPSAPWSVVGAFTRDAIILASGLISTLATVALLAEVEVRFGVALYAWSYWFVIPVGALFSGAVAGSGYHVGARLAQRRPASWAFAVVMTIATAAYFALSFAIYQLKEVKDIRTADLMTFGSFFDLWIQNKRVRTFGDNGMQVGAFGYGFALLQIAGFVFGSVGAYLHAISQPYCAACQRYLVSPVVVKGFSAFEDDVERTYDQVRRFAASGNTIRAVALVRDLSQEESIFQIVLRAWRCAGCAREYASLQMLSYVGSRWKARAPDFLDGLASKPTTSPVASSSDPATLPRARVAWPVATVDRVMVAGTRHGVSTRSILIGAVLVLFAVGATAFLSTTYPLTTPGRAHVSALSTAADQSTRNGSSTSESTPADDLRQAAALFGKGCDGGKSLACFELGQMFEQGLGVFRSDQQAAALYKRACDGGTPVGCTALGILTNAGRGVPKDPAAAGELYERACAAEQLAACHNLALLLQKGDGVAKDEARAAQLLLRACNGKIARACSNLGVAYALGRGVAKDARRAVELFRRGCDGGLAEGCTALGLMYASGTGVARDPARAKKELQRGCTLGDARGCDGAKPPSRLH